MYKFHQKLFFPSASANLKLSGCETAKFGMNMRAAKQYLVCIHMLIMPKQLLVFFLFPIKKRLPCIFWLQNKPICDSWHPTLMLLLSTGHDLPIVTCHHGLHFT